MKHHTRSRRTRKNTQRSKKSAKHRGGNNCRVGLMNPTWGGKCSCCSRQTPVIYNKISQK